MQGVFPSYFQACIFINGLIYFGFQKQFHSHGRKRAKEEKNNTKTPSAHTEYNRPVTSLPAPTSPGFRPNMSAPNEKGRVAKVDKLAGTNRGPA